MVDVTKFKDGKVAWAITGAGHQLLASAEIIISMVRNGYNVELFFSKAGKEVARMFGVLTRFTKLAKSKDITLKLNFPEDQGYSFPICGGFSIDHYSLLIVSPTTANSVAKLVHKIADTLVTNIVSQSLKGRLPVYIVPTDYKAGTCQTIAPIMIDHQICKECPDKGLLHGVCPTGALDLDSQHIPHIDYIKCTACKSCVNTCPHDAITFGEEITIYLHESDVEKTNELAIMNGIRVLKSPTEIEY